jgi:hypothetical protein
MRQSPPARWMVQGAVVVMPLVLALFVVLSML